MKERRVPRGSAIKQPCNYNRIAALIARTTDSATPAITSGADQRNKFFAREIFFY